MEAIIIVSLTFFFLIKIFGYDKFSTLHKYYGLNHHEEEEVMAYVDTLLNLELPEKKRKVNHGEIVSLCSEFLTAGTDTTSTSLQWIMANLVKYPSIQEKLYQEISEVVVHI